MVLSALAAGMLLILTAGCGGGGGGTTETAGEPAPEYEFLLDVSHWQDVTAGLAGDQIPEEDRWVSDVIDKTTGFNRWEQVSLSATKVSGNITVQSVAKYKGGWEDESLSAALSKVKAAEPALLNGFKRDGMVAAFAVGNLEGFIKGLAEWLVEGKSIINALKENPETEEYATSFVFMRMPLKGFYEKMKEGFFPLIGDEVVVVEYVNDEFIGWDEMADAETFIQATPIRTIGAVALGESGLAAATADMLENLGRTSMVLESMGLGGLDLAGLDEMIEVKTMQGDGYDIYYMDYAGDIQVAWAEIGGLMFISDLNTLESIDEYFDESGTGLGVPENYNAYVMLDVDSAKEANKDRYEALIGELKEDANQTYDDELATESKQLLEVLGMAENLGEVSYILRNTDQGYSARLRFGSDAGPLVLELARKYLKVKEDAVAESPAAVD